MNSPIQPDALTSPKEALIRAKARIESIRNRRQNSPISELSNFEFGSPVRRNRPHLPPISTDLQENAPKSKPSMNRDPPEDSGEVDDKFLHRLRSDQVASRRTISPFNSENWDTVGKRESYKRKLKTFAGKPATTELFKSRISLVSKSLTNLKFTKHDPINEDKSKSSQQDFKTQLLNLSKLAEKELLTNYTFIQAPLNCSGNIRKFFLTAIIDPANWVPLPSTWYDGSKARFLELEGFYVGERPEMTKRNEKRMEGRLYLCENDHGRSWFGSDLKLATLPNPVSKHIYRLPYPSPPASTEDIQNCNTSTGLVRLKPLMVNHNKRVGDAHYLLIFSVDKLRFNSHPLMTDEALVSKKLEEWVEELNERRKSGIEEYLGRKLKNLKETYGQQKSTWRKMVEWKNQSEMEGGISKSTTVAQSDQQDPQKPSWSSFYSRNATEKQMELDDRLMKLEMKLGQFRTDIHHTRLLRDTEMQMTRILEFNILKAWDRIKKLRSDQGFTSTDLKLTVTMTATNQGEEEALLKTEIIEEIGEKLDSMNMEYEYELRDYRLKLQAWNKKWRRDVSAREGDAIETGEETESGRKKKKRKGAKITELQKVDPKPEMPEPKAFNRQRLKVDIKRRLESSHKVPGSPLLTINVTHFEVTSEANACPRYEQVRRRQADETEVYLVVHYNDREVMRTSPQRLSFKDFEAEIGGIECGDSVLTTFLRKKSLDDWKLTNVKTFGVKVFDEPVSLKAEVMEKSILGDKFLGEIYIAIPEPTEIENLGDSEISELQFSGLPFKPSIYSPTVGWIDSDRDAFLSGALRIRVVWGIDEKGDILGPVKKEKKYSKSAVAGVKSSSRIVDPLNSVGPSGFLNLRKMMSWIINQQIDPNDPRNSSLLRLKSYGDVSEDLELYARSFLETWGSKLFFRLSLPARILEVALGVGFNERHWLKRQTILKSRHNREVISRAPVPLKDTEIVDSLFERVADNLKTDEMESMTPKNQKPGFLKRIRAHALIAEARHKRCKHFDDFITEQRLPPTDPQVNIFAALFKQNRPLRPDRRERTIMTTDRLQGQSPSLVVKVHSAQNIPTRKAIIKDTGALATAQPVTVRPYLEAHFMGHKLRTTVSEGSNPVWNESLLMPFKPMGNDHSPESLIENGTLTEMVYINLFDEVLVDLTKDDRDRENKILQRRERNWLGSIVVPFSTIYERARVEGNFQVKVPHTFLGYEKISSSTSRGADVLIGIDSTVETTVNLFITLEPPLLTPKPLKLKHASDEDPFILRYAQLWAAQPIERRVWKPTTISLSGKTTLVCRYIRPQQPPKDLTTVEKASRFVSLVPYLSRSSILGGQADIWCTSDQFIDIGAGDHDEHAILLCNYLLFLGKDAYVVLGKGIPEGRTAYVMVIDTDLNGSKTFHLINPVSGDWFKQGDGHCPLKSIGTIFNGTNIWANIQAYEDPARMWLMVDNVKYWKPFFTRGGPTTVVTSNQPERIFYRTVSEDYLRELEKTIEKTLVKNIEGWRGRFPTRWNRMCSRIFQPILKRFEQFVLNRLELPSMLDTSTDWKTLQTMYRICGFPLNMSYTDISALVESVRSTDVFRNEEEGVEYALAVQCTGYNEGVISVWIWIASLKKN